MRPLVRVERPGQHVAEIVLDRPDALNAVSTALALELRAAVAAVAADGSVRALVLSSAVERAFCVGADLKERNGFSDHQLREQALACDLVVADRTAVVGLPEVSVGVLPGGGGTQLLTRRVGWSRAADLVFTARRLGADEALTLGCVDRVVAAGEARTAALALAETIAANSPVGLRQAKAAMRSGFDTDLASGLDLEEAAWQAVAFSPDRAEGVRAFAERRRPVWPGDADEPPRDAGTRGLPSQP